MAYFPRWIAALATLSVLGCAHPLVITPDTSALPPAAGQPVKKNVGYFISAENRARQVTTPGGGGDKVSYFPYAQLEPMVQRVLGNTYDRVFSLASERDQAFISSNGISLVFVPEILTNSSSPSAFTWPPTDFSVYLTCRAYNAEGRLIWQATVDGAGHAEYSEFIGDFSLSAKRASLGAFRKLQDEIGRAPELRY